MMDGWELWLLMVGLAVGAAGMALITVRLPREDDDLGAAERRTEADWIATTIERHGGIAPASLVEEVLELHGAYLDSIRPPVPPRATAPPVPPSWSGSSMAPGSPGSPGSAPWPGSEPPPSTGPAPTAPWPDSESPPPTGPTPGPRAGSPVVPPPAGPPPGRGRPTGGPPPGPPTGPPPGPPPGVGSSG